MDDDPGRERHVWLAILMVLIIVGATVAWVFV